MSLFKRTPCHLCEKLYPESLQFQFHHYYFCLIDFLYLKFHTPVPFLSSRSTSSHYENALWIHDLKMYFLKNGIKSYIDTTYAEGNDQLESRFCLYVFDLNRAREAIISFPRD